MVHACRFTTSVRPSTYIFLKRSAADAAAGPRLCCRHSFSASLLIDRYTCNGHGVFGTQEPSFQVCNRNAGVRFGVVK
jgi:hypothetical protein